MKIFRGEFIQGISKDKLKSADKIIESTWIISGTTDGFRDTQTPVFERIKIQERA